MEVTTKSLDETRRAAAEFLATLPVSDERATVVGLSGELGAGKTAFTKGLAEALGIGTPVTSPTFVLMKRYPLSGQRFEALVHIDTYRLEDPSELKALSFEALLSEPRTLVVIEWAERVEALLPNDAIRVSFNVEGEAERHISY